MQHLLALGLSVALLTITAPAHAGGPRCTLTGPPWLEGRIAAEVPGRMARPSRAVDARRGQAIEVFVVAPGRLEGRTVLFSEDGGPGRVSYQKAGCGRLQVAWRRVEPRPQHTATPAPNRDLAVYANAQVFGAHHGRWIGYDRIEYFETPLPGVSDEPHLVLREAVASTATRPRPPGHEGLGTLRLAASVREEQGPPRSTPGAEDAPAGLISDRVFRFSFRQHDGFLGWLTAFYEVPYLFGSAGEGVRNQAERFLGADCADVLTAALRRVGHRDLGYTNVSGLMDALGPAPGVPLAELPTPAGATPLRFAAEASAAGSGAVRPGDVLAIDYIGAAELPRGWDHIVVLVEDRGPEGVPDGVLGPEDIVADSGDALGLKFAPLKEQGRIQVRAARPHPVPTPAGRRPRETDDPR